VGKGVDFGQSAPVFRRAVVRALVEHRSENGILVYVDWAIDEQPRTRNHVTGGLPAEAGAST
jgi:hypothetical protein